MTCKLATILGLLISGSIFASPSFSAETGTQAAINASGAGMTSAQLEATRPVLSALKSISECQQAVDQIKDRSKEIVDLCTKTTSVQSLSPEFDGGRVITGPYSHTDGKYYVAPKWKLVQVKGEIDKQRSFLAEVISSNQQDARTLRASEDCRQKVEALRAEARQLTVQMTQDTTQMETLITSGGEQSLITASAKNLIKSTEAVERKLKDMEKVLKKEIKD